MSTSALHHLRQPEYTGENRCLPCTVVNLIIAAALSFAVGAIWAGAVGPFAWLVGGIVFVVGLAAVWLRGYLVPGTPELTKRYFPAWLFKLFDKEPIPPEDVDVEARLLSAGVVEPCEQEDDLCLVEGFRIGWHDEIQTVHEEADEREELARELDLNSGNIEFEESGDAVIARTDGQRLGQWESRGALVADLAAARELPEWVDDWSALGAAARSQLTSGLRIFLDTCPVCEGPVVAGMETVESCCCSQEVVAATCDECDARLLEIEAPDPV